MAGHSNNVGVVKAYLKHPLQASWYREYRGQKLVKRGESSSFYFNLTIDMKNKGRRHKAGRDQQLSGMCNCKSTIAHLTRPITSMSSKGVARSGFDKKKWIKRIRGYFKSQTKLHTLI